MKKIDYKKEWKERYNPSRKQVSLIEVPAQQFLMIDGSGDPNTSRAYADAIQALYAVSYHLKFAIKKGPQAIDYVVMPLESLWWTDDMRNFSPQRKEEWNWTAMILQPDFVTEEDVRAAVEAAGKKKELPALPLLRFEKFREGPAAQLMHIGPYSEEGPNIRRVHDYIREQGMRLRGKHHEIYLSDPRRTAPEKWRTIIRQPCG